MTSHVSVQAIAEGLKQQGYLCDLSIANTVYLADALQKPILIEGPAGVGKTELAKAIATWRGYPLIRMQCYEGIDEAKALYEWDYKRQLLHIQSHTGSTIEQDLFAERYLLERPLLKSIRSPHRSLLLIDEVDKSEPEFESMLLELLGDFQVTIPELGTIRAEHIPFVILTSNQSRELSEPLKRRCLYLYIDYPSFDREVDILITRVGGMTRDLAAEAAMVASRLRNWGLQKPPSVSETVDWARALISLGVSSIDEEDIVRTLNVLLKDQSDINKVLREMGTLTNTGKTNTGKTAATFPTEPRV